MGIGPDEKILILTLKKKDTLVFGGLVIPHEGWPDCTVVFINTND